MIFKRRQKKNKSTHHFLLVDRKTPIRLHNHGAQPHILWMSALILTFKKQKVLSARADSKVKAQMMNRLSTKKVPAVLRGQLRLCQAPANEAV